MADHVLDLRDVSRRYGTRLAVDAASFALERGRIACLLGSSGCGKSTLLRMIAGLEPVDAGEIAIGGAVVANAAHGTAPEDRGVGLVFQDLALFPHLDVAGNVGFGLRHLPAAERRVRVAELLERFHAAALAAAWPSTLSGGEQQRVAIARAMAREPALLLLDEPFSGLDGHLRAQVRASVLQDLRAAGATVLMVTHDPAEAMAFADQVILMAEGRILQTGKPEQCYRQPVSDVAARLLGEVVAIPATIAGNTALTALGPLPTTTWMPDGPAIAIVRPEALRLDAAGVPARVAAVRFTGAGHLVEVELARGGVHISVATALAPPTLGSAVGIALESECASVAVVPALPA